MDLEIIILSQVSQTEKDKYHMIALLCGILKKNIQMNLFTKQKQSHRCRKEIYDYWGWRQGEGINWETGVDVYTLLYIKQITNKDLLYSTGNAT